MSARATAVLLAVVLLLQAYAPTCMSGCGSSRVFWRGPNFVVPMPSGANGCNSDAEQLYAQGLELEKQGCGVCVDRFFDVALMTGQCDCCDSSSPRTRRLHDSALQKLVTAGQEFGRLDPRRGLTVDREGIKQLIPVTHHGFVWQAEDFNHLTPVGDYHTDALSHPYRRPGVGVPMVVTSCRRADGAFRPNSSAFAATLRMNVQSGCCVGDVSSQSFGTRLELYDPMRVDVVTVGASSCPIAKDLSAPIVYRLSTKPRNYFSGFVRPNAVSPDTGNSNGNLYTLEPYQAGKPPIIFIHGLLSDPFTWAEMVNELLGQPGFSDRFQIWVFEYPTGSPFLTSSADLRRQLDAAARTFDPMNRDPQLSNIVLAGHSMGGLIAKLQITTSSDRLWRSLANRPFNQVVMPMEVRQDLSRKFFFQPSSRVSRVVYFATPHRGSQFATRLIGRFGSLLVNEREEAKKVHDDLIRDNPDVFSREVRRRNPTSIDLLEPNSKLLLAVDGLPVRCGVAMHSIIGNHCWTLSLGRSDGVVPVKNATESRAITERFVDATHSGVKEDAESVEEFFSILELHMNQCHHSQVLPIPTQSFDLESASLRGSVTTPEFLR